MQHSTPVPTNHIELATEKVYNTYLNCYLRETTSWSKYFREPRHDASAAKLMKSNDCYRWIKIALTAVDKEIFCPLKYYSFTGRHEFKFPIYVRNSKGDSFSELNLEDFCSLTSRDYLDNEGIAHDSGLSALSDRLADSIINTAKFISHRHDVTKDIDSLFEPSISFIKAEQSLLLGHAMHPVAKSRIGFDEEQLTSYSPETGSTFQLHYFLVAPDLVWEAHIDTFISSQLKDQLMQDKDISEEVKNLIACSSKWTVLPCHPWQAQHMLKQDIVKEMLSNGLLMSIGEYGPRYTATSSIRTVYNEDSNFMLKFSLNVQITNSERVNLPKELLRGYEFSQLMESEFGETLRSQYPQFIPITDPGFITVKYKGKVIDGFSTVVRSNPFSKLKEDHVSLLAAWCQDPIFAHQQNRIAKTILAIAHREDRSAHNAAVDWFEKYLQISLVPLVKMYNSHGLFLEGHGQNCLLEVDEFGYPSMFYFRDNQGYFFREGGEHYAQQFLPNLGKESLCIAGIEFLNPKFTYYFVINNIITVINSIGRAGLAPEETLVRSMSDILQELDCTDKTGWVDYMTQSRDLEVKANLMTRLHDYDELVRPLETHAVYVDYPNPFLLRHLSEALINPKTLDTVFAKSDGDLKLSLRPLNLETDLETIHEWFHREHTIDYWAMNMPLQKLEAFYINLEASDYSHAFIGEINGEPAFITEYYWSMRDSVGKHYESLPGDYGMHICISQPKREDRHSLAVIKTILDYLLAQAEVDRCVGESHRDSMAALGLFKKVGYEFQRVINLPQKPANFTILTRQAYRQKTLEHRSNETTETAVDAAL